MCHYKQLKICSSLQTNYVSLSVTDVSCILPSAFLWEPLSPPLFEQASVPKLGIPNLEAQDSANIACDERVG